VTAVDTSVIVPSLAHWHEAHDAARRSAQGASVPAHALLESYSVLSRKDLRGPSSTEPNAPM
jgi:hypothetical protein